MKTVFWGYNPRRIELQAENSSDAAALAVLHYARGVGALLLGENGVPVKLVFKVRTKA